MLTLRLLTFTTLLAGCDIVFSVGALALAWFVLRLWVAPVREKAGASLPGAVEP